MPVDRQAARGAAISITTIVDVDVDAVADVGPMARMVAVAADTLLKGVVTLNKVAEVMPLNRDKTVLLAAEMDRWTAADLRVVVADQKVVNEAHSRNAACNRTSHVVRKF